MQIQDEAPRPEKAFGLNGDYETAVIHIVWDRQHPSGVRTLLFGFVELLPAEMPAPIDDYDPHGERLGGKSEHHIHVRHTVVTASRALSWYLACRRGVALLPENDGQLAAEDDIRATRLRVAELGEEPPWPTVICTADDADSIPFCPQWMECPRAHHLLPVAPFDLDGMWTKGEAERANAIVEDRLHFAIHEYPEYWGSVHLIAPNPVYRAIHTRLQPRTPPAESVLIRFEPRAGKSVAGLELTFRETEGWGATDVRIVRVEQRLVRMNFDREVNAIKEDVLDPTRGPLKIAHLQAGFLKSVELKVNLSSTLVVNPGTPDSYEVMRSGKGNVSRVGAQPTMLSTRSRMLEAYYARRKRAQASEQDQRWFRGQKEEARDVLRGLIHTAVNEVLLVDAYFGANELVNFALAVGQEEVPIKILTAAEMMKRPAGTDGSVIEADLLRNGLKQIREVARMNPFEIRVMAGSRPAVHDRFLRVDERIWLIGSSLNEFGSRGTMMVSLFDPEPVRFQLAKAWDEAMELESWTKRHAGGESAGSSEAQ